MGDWQKDRAYYLGALGQEQSYDLGKYNANLERFQNNRNYYANAYNAAYGNDFAAYQQDQSAEQWQREYEMQKAASDLDNQLKQLQIQKAQLALQQGVIGSGGRSGGRGKSGKNSADKRTTNLIPTVKASDLLSQYAYMKQSGGDSILGSIDADDYLQNVMKNNFIDFKPSFTPIQDSMSRDRMTRIAVDQARKKLKR